MANRKRSAKRNEHDVQSGIIDFLVRVCGMEVIRFNSGATLYGAGGNKRFIFFYTWFGKIGGKMHKGVPDVYAFSPKTGVSAWIEVKKDAKGKERPEQKIFREAVASTVDVAIVASSIDEVAAAIIPALAARGQDVRWLGRDAIPSEGPRVLADGRVEMGGQEGGDEPEAGKRAVPVVRKRAKRKARDSENDHICQPDGGDTPE